MRRLKSIEQACDMFADSSRCYYSHISHTSIELKMTSLCMLCMKPENRVHSVPRPSQERAWNHSPSSRQS